MRPQIFISAVTNEFQSARQLIANILLSLGYTPVLQDIFGTEQGDLREMLRKKIDTCKGIIHLVGHRYGAEPPLEDEEFSRISYTQYEALYARQKGKKVWYLLDTSSPEDYQLSESEELCSLQKRYRAIITGGTHIYHPINLNNNDVVESHVRRLKDELGKLHRSFMFWTWSVTALLLLLLGLVSWGLIIQPQSPFEKITENQANATFVAKNYAAAFDAYTQLSAAEPTNINYHRRVEESARIGLLKKPFLDHYLKLVQQQPTNAIYFNYLGNAYLMIDPKDKDGKARSNYESALKLDPHLVPPLANLGILASREGRVDEAEALFKRYMAVQPDDAQTWVNLSLLYLIKIKADATNTEAIMSSKEAFKKALHIDPGSFAAYRGNDDLRKGAEAGSLDKPRAFFNF